MKNFFDAFRPQSERERFEADLETFDPIARDRAKTIANLVVKLHLSQRPKAKNPADEAIQAALEGKEWERAANLLETKSNRTAGDENDLGVALAHTANEDEDIWKEATTAFAQCEAHRDVDATTKALAVRNSAVARRATEILRA